MKTIVILALLACTTLELRNAVCWALCRKDGYEVGAYVEKKLSCACSNIEKFDQITEITIKILNAHPKGKSNFWD